MSDALLDTATTVAAVGSGLVGGVMLAFSTLVMGGLRELPATQGIRAVQRINAAAIRPVFMLVFVGTGLLSAVLALHSSINLAGSGAILRLIGAVSYLLTIVVTGGFHIPRNKAIDATDPDASTAPEIWQRYLAQWLPGNHVRVLTAGAASALFIVSLTTG